MMKRQQQQLLVRCMLLAGLTLVLLFCVTASTCDGGQYREIGTELARQAQEGDKAERKFMYVADYESKLYWPNRTKYENAIPKGRRVYILDGETLAEFKGYKPGPL